MHYWLVVSKRSPAIVRAKDPDDAIRRYANHYDDYSIGVMVRRLDLIPIISQTGEFVTDFMKAEIVKV